MGSDSQRTVAKKDQSQSNNELLDLYLQRLEKTPGISAETFLEDFPDVSKNVLPLLKTVGDLQAVSPTSQSADPSSRARISRIGNYELKGILGRGGMGLVFLAHQNSLNRDVALKVLAASVAIDPINRQRFQLEAQAAARLQHPHIVQVYEVGNEKGIDFYSMQWIDGLSIAQILEGAEKPESPVPAHLHVGGGASRTTSEAEAAGTDPESLGSDETKPPSFSGKAFTPRDTARIGLALADALSAAHLNGIIHRDIKPSNLMLDAESQPYITDFGLAHVEQELQLTTPGTVIGSLRYMSPEQLDPRQQVVDARCDIYGLGATLYEMLTLRPAISGQERKHVLHNLLHREIVPPRKLNPAIPRDLSTILVKALKPDRNERYSSAREMAADLQAFLDGRPISAVPQSAFRQLVAWTKRNPGVAGLSSALILLLLVTAVGATLVAFQMNRLAKERASLLATAVQQRAAAESLAQFLIRAFRSPDPAIDGRKFTVAEMLGSASSELLTDSSVDDVAKGDLLDAIGQSLRGLGAFEEAAEVHQACFDLRQKVLGLNALPTLKTMCHLALAKRDLSDLSGSIALYEDALNRLRSHFTDEHPDTLEAMGALAMAYQDDMQLDKAEPLQKESLEKRTLHLGPENPKTLQAMNNMALWLQESNRHEEAYELYKEAYELRERVLTERHPDTLQAMANLSGAMQDLGKLEAALSLQEKTLTLHRDVLGEMHPNTLICMNNTALLYYDLGRLDETVELFEEVLEKMRSKLGDTHQDTLIAMGNLAYFYNLVERNQEAVALGEERLTGEIANRGSDHLMVAGCHSMLGSIYFADKQYAKAEKHLRATHEIRQAEGTDGWTTYRDQSKLGAVLVALSKYEEAEPLLVESHRRLSERNQEIPAVIRATILNDASNRLADYYKAVGQPELEHEFRIAEAP